MPARATASNPQQPPSYASYHESPLRTVQLQTDSRSHEPNPTRPALSSDVSRRSSARSLQNTIYDALGSSQPVDLLPHLSKPRVSRSYRRRSAPIQNVEESSTPSAGQDSTSSNTDSMSLNGAPSAVQEKQDISTQTQSYPSILDEVLYATPPGCGHGRGN
jgi:hypothetical protein